MQMKISTWEMTTLTWNQLKRRTSMQMMQFYSVCTFVTQLSVRHLPLQCRLSIKYSQSFSDQFAHEQISNTIWPLKTRIQREWAYCCPPTQRCPCETPRTIIRHRHFIKEPTLSFESQQDKCALGEWVTEMAFVNSAAITGTASHLSRLAAVCKLLSEISVETQFIRLPNQISHTATCWPNSLLVAVRSVTTNISPPSSTCGTLCCPSRGH